MDEFYSPASPENLHQAAALQEIEVRPDVIAQPLDESHGSQILNILSRDPNIRERVTVASRLFSIDDIAKEVAAIKADPGLIRYTILEDGQPVGLVSLWRDDGFFGAAPNPEDYGFGYFIDPEARGKGIVTDTVTRLMEAAQQSMKVRQFVAFCEADNAESISVLSKLGFEKNGETFNEPSHGWLEYKYVRPPLELPNSDNVE